MHIVDTSSLKSFPLHNLRPLILKGTLGSNIRQLKGFKSKKWLYIYLCVWRHLPPSFVLKIANVWKGRKFIARFQALSSSKLSHSEKRKRGYEKHTTSKQHRVIKISCLRRLHQSSISSKPHSLFQRIRSFSHLLVIPNWSCSTTNSVKDTSNSGLRFYGICDYTHSQSWLHNNYIQKRQSHHNHYAQKQKTFIV